MRIWSRAGDRSLVAFARLGSYWRSQVYALRRSQSVSSQLRIVPLSWQNGHSQMIVEPSAPNQACTLPLHLRRPGLRRHGTLVLACCLAWWLVTQPTIEPRKRAMFAS